MDRHATALGHSIGVWTWGLAMLIALGPTSLALSTDEGTPAVGSGQSLPPSATPAPRSPDAAQSKEGAAPRERMQHARKACANDMKKFCAQVKPGGGRILECLEEHSKEVSDDCYDVLEKRMERQKGATH